MPRLVLDPMHDIARERDAIEVEQSAEDFDRRAFALDALELVQPHRTRVAICEGISGGTVRVEAGRLWGAGADARWAILSIPKRASRRAIALAVCELAGRLEDKSAPYLYDVLFTAF